VVLAAATVRVNDTSPRDASPRGGASDSAAAAAAAAAIKLANKSCDAGVLSDILLGRVSVGRSRSA